MWLEWRTSPRKTHSRHHAGTLVDIMPELGHVTVHFLYIDLVCTKWCVFQNWMKLGTLHHVHHVVARVHLQWAGFDVGGADEQVLRYWFSVLQGLQATGLRLVHSSSGEGRRGLKRDGGNARSFYTLSFVNTRQ
ncbi:methyltransferase-like protein 24 [Hippocampus comes]|uniref:methyltransferase-like protein 24 n=1 Tax=Hippocampus comes TaxID=109280 RepID=UPI00094E3469|nr:PREDICTED: methyltransferase-like protein 24 [Hippocampus comes]